MATKAFSVRLDVELIDKIEKLAGKGKRNAWIANALRLALNEKPKKDMTKAETIAKVETDASLGNLLDGGLLAAAQRKQENGENIFDTLTGAEVAKLMAQRVPKNKNTDEEVEADYFSLTSILKRLPGIEDITAALNKAKSLIKKLEGESEIKDGIIAMLQRRLKKECNDEDVKAIIERVKVLARECREDSVMRGLEYEGLLNGTKQ